MRELAQVVAEQMSDAYPELNERLAFIQEIVEREETGFLHVLHQGQALLAQTMKHKGRTGTDATTQPIETRKLDPSVVFRLHSDLGFPADLTAVIAREEGWSVDMTKVEDLMVKERDRSRAASSVADFPTAVENWKTQNLPAVDFTGYSRLEEGNARVLALHADAAKRKLWLALSPSPFYAEEGGQVGDTGTLVWTGGSAEVLDAHQLSDGVDVLVVQPHGMQNESKEETAARWAGALAALSVGQTVAAIVAPERRARIASHHTATHLLHAALRHTIGPSVQQAGSRVGPEFLRFDFTHGQPLTASEILAVERWMRDAISQDAPVQTTVLPLHQALGSGALSLFAESYPPNVRIVDISGLSKEFCGGQYFSLERNKKISQPSTNALVFRNPCEQERPTTSI